MPKLREGARTPMAVMQRNNSGSLRAQRLSEPAANARAERRRSRTPMAGMRKKFGLPMSGLRENT